MTPERSPERDAALRAALPHVPHLGWTVAALEAGARDTGADPVGHRWLFPRGATGALEAWFDLRDRRMAEAAAAEELDVLRIPARIRRLIVLRLEQSADERDALRRALATLALPWNLGLSVQILARTADAIWAAAGDTSADMSWYTRRATLAAVYAATIAFWLREPVDHPATLAFLDRQLARLGRRKPG